MEIKILRMLDHKNVIRFYGNFQDPIAFHLVLELMEGGNLLDNIVRRKRYTEEDARGICKQMFEAVEYCHFHKVVHRDVKPENFLISVQGHSTPKIKLGDFGFATFMFIEDSLEKGPGTPNYVAPEILRAQKYGTVGSQYSIAVTCTYRCSWTHISNSYSVTAIFIYSEGYAVDMWSLGVCIYQLLRGSLPFRDSNLRNLARQICKQEIKCHDEYWRTMSPLAKNFISLLLERNPKERLTAKEALIHPWMTRTGKNVHLSDTMENLRIYNVKRKLRVAVFTLIAINKFMLFGFQRNVALKGLND